MELIAPNRPYAQRYILRPERYNDVCFGFENTLGAFDTLMLEGKQTYQPEGDISTFKTYTTEKELINDFTSIWEASTGRLETERSANQFQDFLKSTNRYVLMQGIWRRIIVSDYKVKHSRGESNSYTFKYHLADKNEGHQGVKNPDRKGQGSNGPRKQSDGSSQRRDGRGKKGYICNEPRGDEGQPGRNPRRESRGGTARRRGGNPFCDQSNGRGTRRDTDHAGNATPDHEGRIPRAGPSAGRISRAYHNP